MGQKIERPDNVIKRLRKKHGLTEQELADYCQVSRNYIVRLEQSLYSSPSTAVAHFLGQLEGIPTHEVAGAYSKELDSVLEPLLELLKNTQPDWAMIYHELGDIDWTTSSRHPHAVYRILVFGCLGLPESQIKYAQYTGLHPAVLSKYESTDMADMPASLKHVALNILRTPPGLVELVVRWGQNRHRELRSRD